MPSPGNGLKRATAHQLKLRVRTDVTFGEIRSAKDLRSPDTPSVEALAFYSRIDRLPGPEYVERAGVRLAKYGRVLVEEKYAGLYEGVRQKFLMLLLPKYLARLENNDEPEILMVLYEAHSKEAKLRKVPSCSSLAHEMSNGSILLEEGSEIYDFCQKFEDSKSRRFVILHAINKGFVTCTGGLLPPEPGLMHELIHALLDWGPRRLYRVGTTWKSAS